MTSLAQATVTQHLIREEDQTNYKSGLNSQICPFTWYHLKFVFQGDCESFGDNVLLQKKQIQIKI